MAVKRFLSTLLALALLLGCMGWAPVLAAERHDADATVTGQQPADSKAKEPTEQSLAEELARECKDNGMFRHIDEETFRRAGHTRRLVEEEELNTYVFQNQDGTKSVYYMERDVKYISSNGEVRDKDITLVSKGNGYGMRDNNVELLLPNRAADGIAMSYGRSRVQLVPQGGSGEAELRDNAVIYENFYGEGTALKYSPMLSGVKEDIILDAYTGVSSFCFVLHTGRLNLYESEGQYYLAEREDAEAVFYLGQIVVYDAVGCPSMGSMTVETLVEGEEYRLTISADVEFLTAPTTVYPVTIDPTITITDSTEGGVIEDAPVYSGYPNTNFGNYVFNAVGYIDENYGIGRTVVRLNGLLENETFATVGAYYIQKVEFYMKDGGSSSAVVNIHGLARNSTWTESTITWNTVNAHNLAVSASATMGGGAWTAFDITTLAKQWKAGTQNGQCGFIMIGAEEDTKKIGALSCEYGTGDYWPYVVVNYSIDLPLNYYAKAIQKGSGFTLIAYGEDGRALDDVTWTSNNPSVATVSAAGVVTGIRAGTATITASNADGYSTPCTVYVTIPDGVYYIKNASSGYCLQASGSIVSIYPQETDQEERIDQLWQIEYESNGQYRIYSMQDLNVAMGANNSSKYVTLGSAPAVGNWGIVENAFGYAIRYGGSSSDNIKPAVSGMSGSMTRIGAWESNPACQWKLEEVCGIFLRDTNSKKLVDGNTVITIDPGEDYTMSNLGLELKIFSNTISSMTWSSSNRTVANAYGGEIDAYTRGGMTEISVNATLNSVTYRAEFMLKVNKNAIIIVPGIMGTELVLAENVYSNQGDSLLYAKGTELWAKSLLDDYEAGSITEADLVEILCLLTCDSNGTSNYSVIPRNNQYGADDVYKGLYTALEDEYGKNYLIEFFAYDWRLSNQISASYLNDFIIENGYDNVVLVCHSMGGLVASGYLALGESQRTKVETVITLGSPLFGAQTMPCLWGQEDSTWLEMFGVDAMPEWGAILIDYVAPFDYILTNLASVHELFPTKYYFDSVYSSSFYLTFSARVNGSLEEMTLEEYELTRVAFENHLNYYNSTLADAAEAFHDSTYQESEHVTAKVNSYYIAGYGHDTVDTLTCTVDGETSWTFGTSQYGDSMVSTWSATLGDYYSDRTFYARNINHMSLVSDTAVLQFIIDLIAGQTTATNFVVTQNIW